MYRHTQNGCRNTGLIKTTNKHLRLSTARLRMSLHDIQQAEISGCTLLSFGLSWFIFRHEYSIYI